MKKNLWVLLALSALIAMFVIAGCAPKPSPSPTPTPTATPTAPPADTACPKVVSTEVVKTYYGGSCIEGCGWDPRPVNGSTNCFDVDGEMTGTGAFKIIITFDENIDPIKSSCVLNPANWTIGVINPDRLIDDDDLEYSIIDITINGKQIIVTAAVVEDNTHKVWILPGPNEVDIDYTFCGLICNLNDANSYADVVNGADLGLGPIVSGAKAAPTVADEVYWKLSSGCVVSDELGNWCCDFDGKDCCVEPICETCAPCPLEGSICQ
jgi:hypothetical protein